jgi:hypothetical protein
VLRANALSNLLAVFVGLLRDKVAIADNMCRYACASLGSRLCFAEQQTHKKELAGRSKVPHGQIMRADSETNSAVFKKSAPIESNFAQNIMVAPLLTSSGIQNA